MSPGLTPRERASRCANDFSHTSLNFFRFTLRASGSLSPDIKTRDTQRPTRRRWVRSTWDQCQAHHNVFVLPLYLPPRLRLRLRLFEKLQSHENHDTTTAKWARVRSSCRREHILPAPRHAVPFWDASCATFFHGAPKLRELRGGTGARRGCFDGRGSR